MVRDGLRVNPVAGLGVEFVKYGGHAGARVDQGQVQVDSHSQWRAHARWLRIVADGVGLAIRSGRRVLVAQQRDREWELDVVSKRRKRTRSRRGELGDGMPLFTARPRRLNVYKLAGGVAVLLRHDGPFRFQSSGCAAHAANDALVVSFRAKPTESAAVSLTRPPARLPGVLPFIE